MHMCAVSDSVVVVEKHSMLVHTYTLSTITAIFIGNVPRVIILQIVWNLTKKDAVLLLFARVYQLQRTIL